MKINAFDSTFPYLVSLGQTTLDYSTGSNSAEGDLSGGGDVVGSPGDYVVVGLRDTVSLASNIGGGTLGDVLTIVQTSPRLAMFAAPSNTGIGSNAMTRTTGGQSTVTTIAASGTTLTLDLGGANYFDVTLTANCTIGFTGWASAGALSEIGVRVSEDGAGGHTLAWTGVSWLGGSAPTHVDTAGTAEEYVFWSDDAGSTIVGGKVGSGSTASPLTTKGDLWTYSTTDARLAVGSNGTGLLADSAATTGNRWTVQRIAGELLMQDGVTAPPVPIETESQDDWLYADL